MSHENDSMNDHMMSDGYNAINPITYALQKRQHSQSFPAEITSVERAVANKMNHTTILEYETKIYLLFKDAFIDARNSNIKFYQFTRL